ncbi:MAG: hypothetical protein HC906_05285 [Bacteroidales bacterium]|nr:hypothetical protein [Bacteroidales bacterium]
MLETIHKPGTLLLGFTLSLVISLATQFIIIQKFIKQTIAEVQKKLHPNRKWFISLETYLIFGLLFSGFGILIFQAVSDQKYNPVLFFISGTILLVAFLTSIHRILYLLDSTLFSTLNIRFLGIKNLIRNKSRSIAIVFTLTLGTFTVISTGSNRKDFSQVNKPTSGTGGFDFYAQSTVPILRNLNDQSVKDDFTLPDSVNIVQIALQSGDDASCLNLNRISTPPVFGVNPVQLSGRFSFVSQVDEFSGWNSLNKKTGNVVPGIADETVIKWGLGKKTGDTLHYLNESGDTLYIRLIAGLANSIFQGNVLISDTFFRENFPSSSGSNVFLLKTMKSDTSGLHSELNSVFRDYGWEMERTSDRLTLFGSVETTYLKIFLALGGLGLILGTFGLIIVLARSIYERRKELALLMASGFLPAQIHRLLIMEYSILLVTGIIGGTLTALIAVFPALQINSFQNAFFVSGLILVMIINGLIWIWAITKKQISKMSFKKVLGEE